MTVKFSYVNDAIRGITGEGIVERRCIKVTSSSIAMSLDGDLSFKDNSGTAWSLRPSELKSLIITQD